MFNKFLQIALVLAITPISLMASTDPTDGDRRGRASMRRVNPTMSETAAYVDGKKSLEELNDKRAARGESSLTSDDLDRHRSYLSQMRDLGSSMYSGAVGFAKGIGKK